MSILTLTNITQQFGDKILYEDVQLQLNAGEHLGLIGQNGAGKSTLIKIITGEILPDNGHIQWQKNIHRGYLDQYVEVDEQLTIQEFLKTAYADEFEKEQKIGELYTQYGETFDDSLLEKAGKLQTELDQGIFYQIDTLVAEMSSGLGLDVLGANTLLKELSGGQRSKVILAKLLLENPDVLILDEPTNHLDDQHIQWLTQFLQSFQGAYIVISHDQEFLDQITTHIADIEFGQLTKYTGHLKQALKQKEQNRESYLRQYHAQQKQIEKTEAYIRKYKAGSRSTMAKSRQKQLDKVDRLKPPTNTATAVFDFPFTPIVTTLALETTDLVIGYERPLLAPINLTIRFGETVAIRGFNGIGKSTLLKTLIGEIKQLDGDFHFPENTKINYFSQDLTWETPLETPLQYLSGHFPKATIKELRRQLAKAGLVNQLASEPLATLSGGEQTKVKLAQMTMNSGNLLILDEPTNHIDHETKASLQKGIQQFTGTVLVVSHEQEFYQELVDRVIEIETNEATYSSKH
ncbi:multidrug ABC transporter ATP-binding protein [Enterococcus thailandicus]|uniref:ABC-F family ATP-binding cassette domain-containing protein n=1 Tax=Enterococcus thailandicus TaxID=417368 RepID=UPI00244D7E0F|nr:ABC-F family ATP-binding cassette domain-containing protein [Enterococcus thailandicus]GMC02777.1 multidrug ABC transporter ATP-binding protein [Enterococcus thailandicus]GMC09109.1 multidrug ABC transporter ATP-binding protein [Enterococcus thailandicus]